NRVTLAEFYAATGNAAKATAVYEEMANTPAATLAKQRLALLYFNQKDFDKALRITDDLLKVNDKDTDARIIRGRAYLAKQNPTEALKELQPAATKDPGSAQARFYLGLAYLLDHKEQPAEDSWAEAIKLDGHFVEPHLALAESKFGSRDFNSAIREAKAA